jgi:hypothetical protein
MRDRVGHKRPWLAALLSVLYPGLGHVYLREWLRGLLWFGLVIATASITVPTAALPAAGSDLTLDAILQASQALPQEATLVLFALVVLSVADAYRLAALGNRRAETATGSRCPHCGHDLDGEDELDFCPWCTAHLDDR